MAELDNRTREIKFRQPVWENGKIIRWHYWGFKDGLYQHPINQHVSNEFTGLFDRNGKEIYEDDIIEWSVFPDDDYIKRIRDVVKYSAGCFIAQNRREILGLKAPYREVEMLGNVHENHKLIENEKAGNNNG